MIQRFAKNRSTQDLVLRVDMIIPSGSISTTNNKHVEGSFILDVVEIVTDSRPSSLALALVLPVSRVSRGTMFPNDLNDIFVTRLIFWASNMVNIFSLYITVHCSLNVLYQCCLKSSCIPFPNILFLSGREEHDKSHFLFLLYKAIYFNWTV